MPKPNWKSALDHLFFNMRAYADLSGEPGVNTAIAMEITFFPLLRRYMNGERSQILFDDIMATK